LKVMVNRASGWTSGKEKMSLSSLSSTIVAP
jgi:hypothetical protein